MKIAFSFHILFIVDLVAASAIGSSVRLEDRSLESRENESKILFDTSSCSPVEFSIVFDEIPSEVGYELVCDETTVWSRKRGSFPPNIYQFATKKESACIESATRCIFTIEDSPRFKDGLTSPFNDEPGDFVLKLDGAIIMSYDGSKYQTLSSDPFCIGQGCKAGESGNSDCSLVLLSLTFDEIPSEVGYDLVCDKEKIWHKTRGTFQPSDFQFATHEETACIKTAESCIFTIEDSPKFKDGLTSPFDEKPGKFSLKVKEKTLFAYDGSDVNAKYEKLTYPSFCIGDGCNNVGESNGNSCVDVELKMKFDEFPSEVSYNLHCDGKSVWDVPRGSYTDRNEFKTIKDKSCVKSTACCTFDVYDSARFADGLTSPQEGKPGNFQVKYGGRTVVTYDGGEDGGYFHNGYNFGSCL